MRYLREWLERSLVRPTAEGSDLHEFSSRHVRDHLRRQVRAGRARDLHRRAATAIEDAPDRYGLSDYVLARHHEQAGDYARAADRYEAHAHACYAAFGYWEAREAYEAAHRMRTKVEGEWRSASGACGSRGMLGATWETKRGARALRRLFGFPRDGPAPPARRLTWVWGASPSGPVSGMRPTSNG